MSIREQSGYVYVIQDGSGLCKIGRARDVQKRIRSLSTGASSELTLVASWPCDDAAEREAIMHEFWSDLRVRGEWFRIPDLIVQSWRESTGTRIPREDDEDAWFEMIHGHDIRVVRSQFLSSGETPSVVPKRIRHAQPMGEWRALPGADGSWWISKQSERIECPRCERDTDDCPGVMRYVEKFDFGGERARCHPKWPALGWVVWRQCEHCSWMEFQKEYVTLDQIRTWALGPWKPMP